MKNYIKSEEELCKVPIPLSTSTYKAVPYCDLIDLTKNGIKKIGLDLKNEIYTATKDGRVATARYDLDYGNDPDMSLSIAWQNSYNKQVSLKFAIGAHVFICSNGACFGDMGSFKKKHVGKIQTVTPGMIESYISTAKEVYDKMVEQKERMKNTTLTNDMKMMILGDLYFGSDILKETQVAIVKRELKKSTYDYKSPGTVWELYNIVTFACKNTHPLNYLETHTQIHDKFVNYFEL